MFPGDADVLRLVVLVLCLIGIALHDRIGLIRRHRVPLMALLCVAGLLAHFDLFSFHRQRGHAHYWEFYNYFIGTKYFSEVGYAGLYGATVVADFEDDRAHFNPRIPVRSLTTYRMLPRERAVSYRDAIKSPFSPERWETFKRDIAVFREAAVDVWRTGSVQRDHGYNGTPLTTAVLGSIARVMPLPTATFVKVFSWADVVLVLLVALAVGRFGGGWTGGLAFIFLWSINPFNDFSFIGGSFLRYLYFAALALAIVAWARGRPAASGVLTALAALFALFPVVFVVGLVAHAFLRPQRRVLLKRVVRFLAGLAATAATVIVVTSFQTGPEGRNPWLAFADNMELHRGKATYNAMGLSYLFLYSEENNYKNTQAAKARGERRDWVAEANRTLDARAPVRRLAQGLLLLLILLYLRRASSTQAWFAGAAGLFTFQFAMHYYYAILSLVPFMFSRSREQIGAVILLWAVVLVPRFSGDSYGIFDWRFFLINLSTTAYFVTALLLGWIRPTPEVGLELPADAS